ncbi:hypothetical protein CHS0354_022073 [Potamilus streckersoni]|uniref:Uncharacterized protein n=1 Tax=Potamilus streckersoni TaxID=2493646 RepID=A0AAE0SSZ8_9BIVA|nr:hypothetical protein CHS0354_022073 [Potamilus streckersoni]
MSWSTDAAIMKKSQIKLNFVYVLFQNCFGDDLLSDVRISGVTYGSHLWHKDKVPKSFFYFRMAWVTYGSPLWHKDKVPDHIHPLPDIHQRKEYESKFINDAIRTQVYHYPRKKPIIPPYDAVKDKYARAYFQSPLVKAILQRTALMQNPVSNLSINFEKTKYSEIFNILKLSNFMKVAPLHEIASLFST